MPGLFFVKIMDNNWEDIFRFDDQLTEEERMIRDNVREYCNKSLMPRILYANRNEIFHPEIYKELGELGILGASIQGYGCAGVGYVSYGLITREIEKIDSSYRSALAFNPHWLCMLSINSVPKHRKTNYCLKWQWEI